MKVDKERFDYYRVVLRWPTCERILYYLIPIFDEMKPISFEREYKENKDWFYIKFETEVGKFKIKLCRAICTSSCSTKSFGDELNNNKVNVEEIKERVDSVERIYE